MALKPLTLALWALVQRVAPELGAMDISPPLSGVELRAILVDEDTELEMQEEERDLVRSIFDLRDTEIREIMVPRVDLRGLEVETSFADAEAYAVQQPFTRLPVWEQSQDRILGILHTKDLLVARVRSETPTLRQLLRPVHFLPESKSVDEALREFRENSVHLAVVVDEYGGTAGIVTMEDILEEIVGEIRDEFDVEGERVRIVDERRAILDPRIDLDDLNEELGLHLPTEDSDTLGGFLYSELGRVPIRGDTVEYQGLHFTIDRLDRQRMLQVTLRSSEPMLRGDGSGGREGENGT
jgi:CBS domain containing-hemolysin-like protein